MVVVEGRVVVVEGLLVPLVLEICLYEIGTGSEFLPLVESGPLRDCLNGILSLLPSPFFFFLN